MKVLWFIVSATWFPKKSKQLVSLWRFSNKTTERLSQAPSYVSKSVKFDWQNMEVRKEITRQGRFTAYWQISLYMFCFTAWPLWYAGISEYGSRGNRGETFTRDGEQGTECASERCESLLRVTEFRRNCVTFSTLKESLGSIFIHLHLHFPRVLPLLASHSLLSFHPLLYTSLHLYSLSFSSFSFHLLFFSFTWPLVICPTYHTFSL